jgi:hypothetical protein
MEKKLRTETGQHDGKSSISTNSYISDALAPTAAPGAKEPTSTAPCPACGNPDGAHECAEILRELTRPNRAPGAKAVVSEESRGFAGAFDDAAARGESRCGVCLSTAHSTEGHTGNTAEPDLSTLLEMIGLADAGRCMACGWPIHNLDAKGCLLGNCSMRSTQPDEFAVRWKHRSQVLIRARKYLAGNLAGNDPLPAGGLPTAADLDAVEAERKTGKL